MPSDIAGILLGLSRLAADVITDIGGGLLTDYSPLAYHHADRPQVLPQGLIPNPAGVVDREVLAALRAAVAPLDRLVIAIAALAIRLVQLGSEAGLNVFHQPLLVVLHGQYVMPVAFPDLASNVLLTAHRINGHDGPREVEQLQQPGNRRDLIGLVADGYLAQGQVVGRCPGTHQVQGRLPRPSVV